MASKTPTFCITTYDEFRSLNGDNIVINYLVLELLKRKFPVEMVVVNEETAERCRERFKGIEFSWLDLSINRGSSSRFHTYFKYVKQAVRVLSKTDHDIYYGHHLPPSLAVCLADIKGRKACGIDDLWSLYWSELHPAPPMRFVSKPIRYCERLVFRKTDVLFTTSHYNLKMFASLGANKERIIPVGIGSDPSIFTNVKNKEDVMKKYNLDWSKKYIIYQGGIKSHDGVHYLIHALPAITKDHPDVITLIVGQGSEVGRLKRLVIRYSLEKNVCFTGWVDQSDLAALMALSRVNVIPLVNTPSTQGVMPYKLSEAMMLGVPTVASDLPGIRELTTDGKHCLLVEAGNTAALATSIHTLLTDKSLHKKLSEAGKKHVMAYTWQAYAKNLVDHMLAHSNVM